MKALSEIPQSRKAEGATVASCILDPAMVPMVFEICSIADFIDDDYRLCINAIYELWQAGSGIDAMLVRQKIEDQGKDTESLVGSLREALGNTPSAANAEYYARIVREKALERELIKQADSLSRSVYDKALSITERKELFEQAALTIAVEEKAAEQDLAGIAKRIIESLESEDGQICVRTGYDEIDEQIGGFEPGEIVIIAARPSNGKSTMLMEMAMSIAVSTPVLLLSMEMSQEAFCYRVLSQLTGMSILMLKSGSLNDEQKARLRRAEDDLRKYKIYIDETPMLSPSSMASKILKAKAVWGIGCVMLDYLQLMHIPKWRSDNRVQEIARICSEIKAAAKRARIPAIVASQMSRAIESRADGEPKLSDLRDSGAIEQDADHVFFLYPGSTTAYDEKWKPGPNDPRPQNCKVAKCRQGPRDFVVTFQWNPGGYTFKTNNQYWQGPGEQAIDRRDDIPF